jgi:predicted small secreted protein
MRAIIFAALAAVLLSMNIACNTVHGAGQDIERAGEKTQDAADSVKRKL